MKYFVRFFRAARNRRRNSRIPGLFESMKSFNAIGDGKIPWKIVGAPRPILGPCFVRFVRID